MEAQAHPTLTRRLPTSLIMLNHYTHLLTRECIDLHAMHTHTLMHSTPSHNLLMQAKSIKNQPQGEIEEKYTKHD